jgi:HNH endonuclease
MDASEFWQHIDTKGGSEACWLWTGPRHPRSGEGHLTFGPRRKTAHRVAYELVYGPIPGDRIVIHSCANPLCCNPSHLVLATRADLARRRREQP